MRPEGHRIAGLQRNVPVGRTGPRFCGAVVEFCRRNSSVSERHQLLLISRISHDFANCQSRSAVLGEIPSTSAIFSILSPPK